MGDRIMRDFHVQLALEWFQARPTRERTAETLAAIVAHGSTVHALSPEETAGIQERALAEAQRRGLIHPS